MYYKMKKKIHDSNHIMLKISGYQYWGGNSLMGSKKVLKMWSEMLYLDSKMSLVGSFQPIQNKFFLPKDNA